MCLFFCFSSYYNFLMKLLKTESPYLTRQQWTKIFLIMSVMTLVLYVAAMIASLCGSKYFILNYQNQQMNRIENWLKQYQIYPLAMLMFNAIEFSIILSFILKRLPAGYYVVGYCLTAIFVSVFFKNAPAIVYQTMAFGFYLVIPLIQQGLDNAKSEYKVKFSWKKYGFCVLRLVIATAVTLLLQAMILIIKAGYFDGQNHIMNLSATFIYALEYDIALAVILFTILLAYKEKGDSKQWATFQVPGGSSQTSKMQSQKSNPKKNLTKTQRNKIRRLYIRMYLIQIGAFLLVMILPFLLGKVLEFLTMYLAFAVARYILGFSYSLHFKKESICITVGVIVFAILSLAVPFFYVVMILAIILGVALAILLHLSYKYKGMWLFTQAAKPDKFALLYVFFDGDMSEHNVKKWCRHKSLTDGETQMIWDYAQGNKISYIAWRNNYSRRMTIYKLDEAIDKLIS